jgi:hypothetical protein
MTLEAFLEHLRTEDLEDGVTNKIAKPAKAADIEAWQKKHPDFPLPDAYKSLLLAANGFAVHATDDSPKGLLRMLPIKSVKPLAEQVMDVAGLEEEDLTDPPTCLMVGEDQDSAWCLGLDVATGRFLEVDYAGESVDVSELPAMLDWLVAKTKDE